eukprot:10710958-Karenia_brevis.AAC.1
MTLRMLCSGRTCNSGCDTSSPASLFVCPFCDGVCDRFMDHCHTCSGGGDRTKKHNFVRDEHTWLCRRGGLRPEPEKVGLLRPRPLVGGRQEDGAELSETSQDPVSRRPAD